MKITSKHSKTYLRFLSLASAVHDLPGVPQLDSTEEKLLNLIAVSLYQGNKINVLEAMSLVPDASPARVHRRLKTLRKKNLIRLDVDGDDNRVKYVEMTDLALDYFSKMGHYLSTANKAT
jgi:hypothetical protein